MPQGMCWPYGKTQQTANSGLYERQWEGSSAPPLRVSADRPFIRGLIDCFRVSNASRRVSVIAAPGAKVALLSLWEPQRWRWPYPALFLSNPSL
ncbi:hypothetical protein V8C37DRAFT_384169 [Trichoderma ceciliae]